MFRAKNYIKAESLKEAYELNQKKGNVVVGGFLWLKMGARNKHTAIDLGGLGLDTIEETEDEFIIGAMCTLRDLETHKGLNNYFSNAVKESVCHIVGVQFRNGATVGGSIFGRFGFSDVLTCFLALDTLVELYQGGLISLEEFCKRKRDRDILICLHVKKDKRKIFYGSERRTSTDFPVIACAVAKRGNQWFVSVGARPYRAGLCQIHKELPAGMEAVRIEQNLQEREKLRQSYARELAEDAADKFHYGSNLRGSGEYRKHLAKVWIKRGILNLLEGGEMDGN